MNYLLRQKLLAFGDDFYIKDVHGNDVYFVDGEGFSLGDQLSFQVHARRHVWHRHRAR